MSEVAAVVLRTADPGLPGGVPTHPNRARRCLFGPPDPESARKVLELERDRIYAMQKLTWNFDFEHERPLEGGRFVWKVVNSAKKDCEEEREKVRKTAEQQAKITDFMRKRKLSTTNQKKTEASEERQPKKVRRRNST